MPASLKASEPALRDLIALPLKLRARVLARAMWSGIETTRRRGPGGVFRELREYRPGDPLSRIDWRASARTDRWLVRELERTSHLRILIVLDRTDSMAYPDTGPASKAALAVTLAAGLAVHALHQGHAVAVWDGDEAGSRPGTGVRTEAHVLARLADPARSGRAFPDALEQAHRVADLVLLISDWLDAEAVGAMQTMGLVAARGVEFRALQLLHDDELDFPFKGPHEFVPLEGGDTPPLRLEAQEVAAQYEANLHDHLRAVNRAAYEAGLALHRHRLKGDPFGAATYLATGIAP